MSNQSKRQLAIRALTGTVMPHEGDWHALWDSLAIPVGPFDSRMLAWINGVLGGGYTNLADAQTAYARAAGYYDWDSLIEVPIVIGAGTALLWGAGNDLRWSTDQLFWG